MTISKNRNKVDLFFLKKIAFFFKKKDAEENRKKLI